MRDIVFYQRDWESYKVQKAIQQANPLAIKVNYVYRPNHQGQMRLLTEGATLHSGDTYKIIFTPGKKGYVYIYQVDSQDKVYQLFPMKKFQGIHLGNTNPVNANQQYILPAKYKSFQLDEVTGEESIYFIATLTPDPQLENLQVNEAGRLREITKLRGVGGIVDDPSTDQALIKELSNYAKQI